MSVSQPVAGFTFADQLEEKNFSGWAPHELATLQTARKTGNLLPFLNVLAQRLVLNNPNVALASLYGIVHDLDTQKQWDAQAAGYIHVPKVWHVHVFAEFEGGRGGGLTLSQIAFSLGYPEHMIEKPKRGKYALDNLKAYLIHAKDADKHLYAPSQVFTLIGKPYPELYSEQKEAWDRGRAAKARKRAKLEVDVIVELARNGKIFEDQLLLDDELYEVYSLPENQRKIDQALNIYARRCMAKAASEMRQNLFSTLTLFFQGSSGSCKSMLAEVLVTFICSLLGWRYLRVATKNALDDYNGEQIILMDDVRGDAVTFETWLGLIDPNHESTAAARYRNKRNVAPRLLVITSNQAPVEFFFYSTSSRKEKMPDEIDATMRRIGAYLQFENLFDVGPYNVTLSKPRRGKPYVYSIRTGRDAYDHMDQGFVEKYVDLPLRYRFENVFENGDQLTVYGALLALLPLLNECSYKEESLINVEDPAVVQGAITMLQKDLSLAAAKGAIPLLPTPTTDEELRGTRHVKRQEVSHVNY